ncbi:MAG: GtrA family protein [Caulobacteraceae bacterium]
MSIFPEALKVGRHRPAWLGARAPELWRYYRVGVLNTAFGYALFSILVFFGINLYLAQIISHICGSAFNYYTYSRHVFHGHHVQIWRFATSYMVNYLLGLGLLWAIHRAIPSAYLAGLLALACVSIINYVILKAFVFRKRRVNDAG